MNHLDDDTLLDDLRDELDELLSGVTAPTDISRAARRVAHRRSATRAVGLGVPAVAGAAVAVAMVTGTSGHRQLTADSPGDTASLNSVPAGHAVDTAYVVTRVKSALASGVHDGGIVAESVQPPAPGVPDSGTWTSYAWTDPQTGVRYQHDTFSDAGGAVTSSDEIRETAANGMWTFHTLDIDNAQRTYSESTSSQPAKPAGGLNGESDAAAIEQALENGTAQRRGTDTIDGQPVIVLTVSGEQDLTLYVSASTYQPVRAVWGTGDATGPHNSPLTVNILPASAPNVALARQAAIPAGFTRVAPTIAHSS